MKRIKPSRQPPLCKVPTAGNALEKPRTQPGYRMKSGPRLSLAGPGPGPPPSPTQRPSHLCPEHFVLHEPARVNWPTYLPWACWGLGGWRKPHPHSPAAVAPAKPSVLGEEREGSALPVPGSGARVRRGQDPVTWSFRTGEGLEEMPRQQAQPKGSGGHPGYSRGHQENHRPNVPRPYGYMALGPLPGPGGLYRNKQSLAWHHTRRGGTKRGWCVTHTSPTHTS